MKVRKFKGLSRSFLGAITISLSTFAVAGGIEMAPSDSGPFLSLFGGVNWITSGTTTAVNLAGITTNLYVAETSTAAAGPIIGGEVGYHYAVSQKFWLEGGIESSYTNMTSFYGIVHPLYFVSPTFDTLSFNYEAQAVPLFAMLKIGGKFFGWFEPYAIGGAGVSWNQAYNYNEIPTDANATALPMRTMFTQLTQINFAWTAGAGLGFQATQSTEVALEYRYISYGDLGLNPAGGQSTSQTVSLGDMTSNALMLRMTIVWAQ